MRRRDFGRGVIGGAALLACPALIRPAAAEASRVRIAKQYGLPYLPLMVMEAQNLVERHTAAAGLGTVAVEWPRLTGPSALNDGLLAGELDLVVVGAPSLLTLWDKTEGTPQEIRALSAVQSQLFVLVSRDPAVKSIADFTDKNRIAVPSVKISAQAVVLEMAAAKLWGFEQYGKLDPLTVTLAHPDAVAAVLGGKSEVDSHYTVAPFYLIELADPRVHVVLRSYDTFGGKHINGILLASKRFHDGNPKLTAAVLAAQEEANAFIKAHPREAGQIYQQLSGDKRDTVDALERMIADPDLDYTTTPAGLMQWAEFLNKVGRVKRIPADWKGYFFAEIHGQAGS